jgi:acetylornithine deacetylase
MCESEGELQLQLQDRFRKLPGDYEPVLRELGDKIPDLDGKLTPGLYRPGSEVPSESVLVRTLLGAMEDEGRPPTVEGMTAWVDAAFLNERGVPAVCFGPGSIAQAHAAQEWVEVEELEVGAKILRRFVRRFLKGAGSPS